MTAIRRVLVVVCTVALTAVATLAWWVESGATVLTVTQTAVGGQRWQPGSPLYVLLIGDDKRPGAGCGCTDAIHLVGIPAGGGAATMIDIPRDTRVPIPGRGNRKINEAFAVGGNTTTAQVVGALAGVTVSYVVHVNFVEFPKLVDEIGGVDVDLATSMRDPNSGANFPKGLNHFDGTQALAYSRTRHIPGGDLARSENQGRLIIAALAKVQSMGTAGKDTVRQLGALLRHTDTNMSPIEIYRLGRAAMGLSPAAIRNVVLPSRATTIGGTSYVVTTADAAPLLADFADDAVLQTH